MHPPYAHYSCPLSLATGLNALTIEPHQHFVTCLRKQISFRGDAGTNEITFSAQVVKEKNEIGGMTTLAKVANSKPKSRNINKLLFSWYMQGHAKFVRVCDSCVCAFSHLFWAPVNIYFGHKVGGQARVTQKEGQKGAYVSFCLSAVLVSFLPSSFLSREGCNLAPFFRQPLSSMCLFTSDMSVFFTHKICFEKI